MPRGDLVNRESKQEQVHEDVAPLYPYLYRLIDAACAGAKDYFLAQDAPIDAALASYIVRWSFLKALRAEQALLNISTIEELGLSGISFWYNGYHMRMWKADDDDITRLASSSAKEAFFDQLTFWDTEFPSTLNLAILWDVDRDWHLRLFQMGPPVRRDGRFKLDWHLDIPTPAESPHAIVPNPDERESTDLHFERDDAEMDHKQG